MRELTEREMQLVTGGATLMGGALWQQVGLAAMAGVGVALAKQQPLKSGMATIGQMMPRGAP